MGRRVGVVIAVALGATAFHAPAAFGASAQSALTIGSRGLDVKRLEIRVAGWFPGSGQSGLDIDRSFDSKTARAVAAFQEQVGLPSDGVAGPATLDALAKLEDADGSTAHFDYSEFQQKRNPRCSKAANRYAGTFEGGQISRWKVRKNVTRLMWRLEAIRAKGGGNPIVINSGFRSVAYNDCLGGASLSQHMYGTAVDAVMVKTANRTARDIARRSHVEGIGCYSSLTHNHFDLRVENSWLPSTRFWWWPDQDEHGRDLADDGRPCWGETKREGVVTAREGALLEQQPEPFLNGAD